MINAKYENKDMIRSQEWIIAWCLISVWVKNVCCLFSTLLWHLGCGFSAQQWPSLKKSPQSQSKEALLPELSSKDAFCAFCLWILWNALEMLLEGNERIRDLFIPNQSSCNWWTVEDVNMLGLLLCVGRLFRCSLSVNSIPVTACEVVPVLRSPSHYRQPNLLIPPKIKSVRCSFYSRGQNTLILLCPFPKWYHFNS